MSRVNNINYYKQSVKRTPCQKCNDTNIEFLMKKDLETCSACNQMLCCQCFGAHRSKCHYDHLPEETKAKLKEESQKLKEEMEMSTEVSENPEENCCNCGYKRHRKGAVWDIYIKGKKTCKSCKKDFCAFCHVGMIKKTLFCKNGVTGFLKRFTKNEPETNDNTTVSFNHGFILVNGEARQLE